MISWSDGGGVINKEGGRFRKTTNLGTFIQIQILGMLIY